MLEWWRFLQTQILAELWRDIIRLRRALYVVVWTLKYPILKGFFQVSRLFLLAAAFLVVVDISITYFNHHRIIAWLDQLVVDYHVGWWLEGKARYVVLVVAGILLLHRYKEWKDRRQQVYFIKSVEVIFDEMGALSTMDGMPERRERLRHLVARVMSVAKNAFQEKHAINVNVMLPDPSGRLRVEYFYPEEVAYDPNFSLAPGKGGAGTAFSEKTIVYIPSIKQRHGIGMTIPEYKEGKIRDASLEFKADVYEPIPSEYEVFSSIISAPIVGKAGIYGVLNLDSSKSDAFDQQDALVANAFARALGVAFGLCESPPFLGDEDDENA